MQTDMITFKGFLNEDEGGVTTTSAIVGGSPMLFKGGLMTRKNLDESKHESSSCQFTLDKFLTDTIIEYARYLVSEQDVTEEGYIKYPHVTLKYGIKSNDCTEVFTLLEHDILRPTYIDILETDYFECTKFDVVILRVKSDKLIELNKRICESLDVEDSDYVYNPHITLAYVNKGTGVKYTDMNELSQTGVKLNKFHFSNKEEVVTDFL